MIGIPLIIASGKFKKVRQASDEELVVMRSNILGWGIFSVIVLAPSVVGLIIVLICAFTANRYINKLELSPECKSIIWQCC